MYRIFHRLLPLVTLLVTLASVRCEDSLQAVDDAELSKLIKEEKFVVALFCTAANEERCEEFEGELIGIREDAIDVMEGDGWVVKVVDSGIMDQYYVGKTEQPVIIMFRNSLPVIYNGVFVCG